MGSGVAIVTPFNEDNEVNYDIFEELIEMHINNKTDAIIVCGTTGEASAMTVDEHLSCISFAVNKVKKRIPVIAGCGSNDTAHAVTMSKSAQRLGADALLSVTPYYNKANKEGLISHYKSIAAACDIPIILYNVPQRTGVNIPIDVLKELSLVDNIVGIKEASQNMSYAAQIASEINALYLYSGNDDITVPVMSLGGVGVISVAANIVPDKMHDMCANYLNGNIGLSKQIQLDLLPLINKLFLEVNPVCIKRAMREIGYNVGKTRLPLGKMDEKNEKILINEINKYRIKKLS